VDGAMTSVELNSSKESAAGETGSSKLAVPKVLTAQGDAWVLWQQMSQPEGTDWSQNYSDALHMVASLSTEHDFLLQEAFSCLPRPSYFLKNAMEDEQVRKHRVRSSALMIFRVGVLPEWEHPANANGGHFEVQMKPSVGGEQMDIYWGNLVRGVVGGTIEPSSMITGVRLVDKCAGPKRAQKVRIELWFSEYEEESNDLATLRKSLEYCLAMRPDGSRGDVPKPDIKSHSAHTKPKLVKGARRTNSEQEAAEIWQ